jgi:hypothetical protein
MPCGVQLDVQFQYTLSAVGTPTVQLVAAALEERSSFGMSKTHALAIQVDQATLSAGTVVVRRRPAGVGTTVGERWRRSSDHDDGRQPDDPEDVVHTCLLSASVHSRDAARQV